MRFFISKYIGYGLRVGVSQNVNKNFISSVWAVLRALALAIFASGTFVIAVPGMSRSPLILFGVALVFVYAYCICWSLRVGLRFWRVFGIALASYTAMIWVAGFVMGVLGAPRWVGLFLLASSFVLCAGFAWIALTTKSRPMLGHGSPNDQAIASGMD